MTGVQNVEKKLFDALYEHDPVALEAALRDGADANTEFKADLWSISGETPTPLMVLNRIGGKTDSRIDCMKRLIAYGADVNRSGASGSALNWCWNEQVALFLILAGADVNNKGPSGRGTFAHNAARFASSKDGRAVFQALAENGADFSLLNGEGLDVLAEATHWSNLTAVKMLIKLGVNPNHIQIGSTGNVQEGTNAVIIAFRKLFSYSKPTSQEVRIFELLCQGGVDETIKKMVLKSTAYSLYGSQGSAKFAQFAEMLDKGAACFEKKELSGVTQKAKKGSKKTL